MNKQTTFILDLQVGQIIQLKGYGKLTVTDVIVNESLVTIETRGFLDNERHSFTFSYPVFTEIKAL